MNSGKREKDRLSGTGRGKEIAKNGAGGKHTWGTGEKNIEDEAYEDRDDLDEQPKQPGDIKKDFAPK